MNKTIAGKASSMKAIVISAVTILGAFCLPIKLSPCLNGGAYFPGDGCMSSDLAVLIKTEINRRLSIKEQYCGTGNAEVVYAYWNDLSEFADRFGQFCMDYSRVATHLGL